MLFYFISFCFIVKMFVCRYPIYENYYYYYYKKVFYKFSLFLLHKLLENVESVDFFIARHFFIFCFRPVFFFKLFFSFSF